MTEREKRWVVYGETGEYSDHSLWPVAVFASFDDAAAFANRCQALMDETIGVYNETALDWYDAAERTGLRALDGAFRGACGDTAYSVWELPWFRELPEGMR